jgi:general secretion pathway protein J
MRRARITPHGFTLIELLVAMTIFAILGVLAYGGYSQSARHAEVVRTDMARLKELQTAIWVMTQDFEELTPRPVRDMLGQSLLPAVSADARSEAIVTLTRAGWSNPASVQRSTLQRVQYVLDDETLRRDHWVVLDATLGEEPVRRELIKKVKQVKIRYLDRNGAWSDQWPPLNAQPVGAIRSRPIGVEIAIELEDFGTITRLLEVSG